MKYLLKKFLIPIGNESKLELHKQSYEWLHECNRRDPSLNEDGYCIECEIQMKSSNGIFNVNGQLYNAL